MSSSSSSECDCGDCCYYAYSQERSYGRNVDYGRTPFYATMGQPLIYYTHVQQPPMRRQRSRESSKRNANCFVKAFKWYTQELVPDPQRRSQEFNRNMNGFAMWLDGKYDEFLREGHLNKSIVHLKFKQTSVIEADSIPQNEDCKQSTTKKIGRMKSPWKKRKRQRSKESGDTIRKSTQSFEYILPPKGLSRPASESCHVSPTTVYNPSNTTIIKPSNKTQSLTTVRDDKDNKEPPDLIVVHEASKIRKRKEQKAQDVKPADPPKSRVPKVAEGFWSTDVACQCPEENVISAETGIQYDSGILLPVVSKKSSTKVQKTAKQPHKKVHEEYFNDSCTCSKEYVLSVDATSQYQQQNDDESQHICRHKTEIQKAPTHTCPTRTIKSTCCNLKNQDTVLRKPQKVFVNDGVQTSDRSINLEKNAACYPLFMKIVCADKLNDGCKACHPLN